MVLIKKSDWNYYKKILGFTKLENGKKFVLFENGNNDEPGFREVEII